MSYPAAQEALARYRDAHIGALFGDETPRWFTSEWGGVESMAEAFSSDAENQAVSASYADGTYAEKIPAHMKLNYVCALRREIRKQYLSGDEGVYTDVTPFRHGITSAHGAAIFDDALKQVLRKEG